jgi:hypothetical protein
MDTPFIKILKTLEPFGVGQFANINATLIYIFPPTDNIGEPESENISKSIIDLIVYMQKENLINIKDAQFHLISSKSEIYYRWLDNHEIIASITQKGLDTLASNRNQQMITQVNQSVIDTNKATTKNFSRQTIISLLTIVIALLTGYISYLTYLKTSTDAVQEKHLKTLEENIQKLQQEQKQLQNLKISPSNVYEKKDST